MIFQAQAPSFGGIPQAQVAAAGMSSPFWLTLTDPAFQMDVLAVTFVMALLGIAMVGFAVLRCVKEGKHEKIPTVFVQGALTIFLASTAMLAMAAFTKIYEVDPLYFIGGIFWFMMLGLYSPGLFDRWLKIALGAAESRFARFLKGGRDGS